MTLKSIGAFTIAWKAAAVARPADFQGSIVDSLPPSFIYSSTITVAISFTSVASIGRSRRLRYLVGASHLQTVPNMASSDSRAQSEPQAGAQPWEKGHAQYISKDNSKYVDPCQEAANRSLKCLRRNGGSRDMCMDYFDAYRECKKSWQEHLKEEKRKSGSWF